MRVGEPAVIECPDEIVTNEIGASPGLGGFASATVSALNVRDVTERRGENWEDTCHMVVTVRQTIRGLPRVNTALRRGIADLESVATYRDDWAGPTSFVSLVEFIVTV